MAVVRQLLEDKDQTGREMHRLIRQYSGDLRSIMVERNGVPVPMANLSLREVFNLVRSMPYQQDTAPIEVVARPRRIVQEFRNGRDCKKAAILIGSWLRENQIPYRLVASSRRADRKVHHVFPQGKFGGRWKTLDATYRHYKPFQVKRVTAAEVLSA